MPLPEPYLWLIAGMALVALEVMTAPGIGLIFGGFAAILTGILIEAGLVAVADHVSQFALWFALTAVMAILLWKPLKRWRSSAGKQSEFNNMVGDIAVVCQGDLVRGKPGKAKWSGTVMNAELDPSSGVESIQDGTPAVIAAVEGITLKLKPKP